MILRAVHRGPLGPVVLEAAEGFLTGLGWHALPAREDQDPLLDEARRQLDAYFAGRLRGFDLPLRPAGSEFQHAVWRALCAIPYGETRTYGEVAETVEGIPRAVGTACGANPIAIVIPCHRVLAADNRPGGYSGADGLATKRRLLALEAPRVGLFAPAAP